MSESLKRFQNHLKQLFRTENKDFNWGIYRVMNQKNDEITEFIEKELPKIISEKLASLKKDIGEDVEKEIEEIKKNSSKMGIDYETVPRYKELMKIRKQNLSLKDYEDSIYNHLVEFFSRYYQDGDFISRFYFKDGTYLIPYDGSEVDLHWVTKDMYFIKTSDQYQRFSFKAGKFEIVFKVAIIEEEKGNKKGRSSYFVLEEVDWDKNSLIVSFKKIFETEEIENYGKNRTERQDKLNEMAAKQIEKEIKDKGERAPDIVKNLKKFQKRYTEDFFIHKDLKGFLLPQMNFYINQEIINIDAFIDEEGNFNEDLKIIAKVFKDIAKNIIEKLDLLENLKKKIWEKKKFVLESNYVITLDKIQKYRGEDFLKNILDEIVSNKDQVKEWIDLFDIEIKDKKQLIHKKTIHGTNEYKKLPIDTKHFSDEFKWRLLSKIDKIDEKLNGVLIHSENWQPLNLLQEKYREKVKCCYIDPPYNTEKDRTEGRFTYKDNYADCSWLSLINDRISLIHDFINDKGSIFISVDDVEQSKLNELLALKFDQENFIANIIWEKVHTRKNSAKYFSVSHDYIITYAKKKTDWERFLLPREDTSAYKNPDNDPKGPWKPDPVYANNPYDANYTIKKPNGKVLSPPPGQYWRFSEKSINEKIKNDEIIWGSGDTYPMVKRYLSETQQGLVPITIFSRKFAGDNSYANSEIDSLFGNSRPVSYPKPSKLIERICQIVVAPNRKEIVIDFFSGSGTTGHAIISLNNKDNGNRKFLLVEMADYFHTVLNPRIKKVLYSLNWKNGKPQDMDSIGGFFKYHELEQYEDSLENIQFKQERLDTFFDNTDILLRYMLEHGIDKNKSKNFLGVDTEKEFLDLSIKILQKDGTTKLHKVDLIETFNYLIGLEIEKMQSFEDNKRIYYIIIGKMQDKNTIAIWRDPNKLDKEKDREIINKLLQKKTYQNVFVNSDCLVRNYKNIYDEMRKRLW